MSGLLEKYHICDISIPISPDPSQDLLRNLWSALRSCPSVSSFMTSFSLYYTALRPLMNFNSPSAPSGVTLLVALLAYCMIT